MKDKNLQRVWIIAFSCLVWGTAGYAQIPGKDPVWVPQVVNAVPLPDPQYQLGPSGAWLGDIHYLDGKWIMGDSFGGIWNSSNAMNWTSAVFTVDGQPRSLQNAPVRSINRSSNGTYIATFLSGGAPILPGVGIPDNTPRAPIARSTDGVNWDVRPVPSPCGIHFSATDGNGTWIAQGCSNEILLSVDDGMTWTARSTGLPAVRLQAHGYINGVWVLASGVPGAGESIYYSTDLLSWTEALPLPLPTIFPKRTFSLNGHLIMTGSRHFVATSSDGINWTVRFWTSQPGPVIQAGVWHPTFGYILTGEDGVAMYSTDLSTWSCGLIGPALEVVGMAMSPSGEVYASSLPGTLYKLTWQDPTPLTSLQPCG